MPTVLSQDGYDVRIYPNDHKPGHVHVWKAGKEMVINLGDDDHMPSVREVRGMRRSDVAKALRIVFEHQSYLIKEWERING
jgi:hypothetical protein